jgi:hypothetical protein
MRSALCGSHEASVTAEGNILVIKIAGAKPFASAGKPFDPENLAMLVLAIAIFVSFGTPLQFLPNASKVTHRDR